MLAACLLFAWARFVEPQRIHVQETVLTDTGAHARLVLVSDIHLGVYKDSTYLQRLVDRINTLQADAVVIAGDFTYEPDGQSLDAMFAPLASRIGMENVKRELEELAFAELNPDGRASVLARQGYLRERGDKLVPQIEVVGQRMIAGGGHGREAFRRACPLCSAAPPAPPASWCTGR